MSEVVWLLLASKDSSGLVSLGLQLFQSTGFFFFFFLLSTKKELYDLWYLGLIYVEHLDFI